MLAGERQQVSSLMNAELPASLGSNVDPIDGLGAAVGNPQIPASGHEIVDALRVATEAERLVFLRVLSPPRGPIRPSPHASLGTRGLPQDAAALPSCTKVGPREQPSQDVHMLRLFTTHLGPVRFELVELGREPMASAAHPYEGLVGGGAECDM